MADFYSINGYWKDDKTEFEGLIASNTDDSPTDEEENQEHETFLFGFNEDLIQEAIELKEDTVHDFVITSFIKLQKLN